MEHKHTPGPWEAVSNLVRTKRSPDGSGGYLVAECPAGAGNRIEDARLIAAAPDLLSALESIVSDHEFCGDDWGSRRDAWIETARAAIAKAQGDAS